MKITPHNSIIYNVVHKANNSLRNIEKKVTLVAIKLLRALVSVLKKICPFGRGARKRFETKLKKRQVPPTSLESNISISKQKSPTPSASTESKISISKQKSPMPSASTESKSSISKQKSPMPSASTESKSTISKQKSFEDGISDWLNDANVRGKKQEAANRILDCYKNSKTLLNLSYFGLSSIPPEIGNLSNLTTLYLSGNQLRKLSPEIGNLSNLTKLTLRSNQLTELPPEIGNLSNLTELILWDNKLKELPPEIGNLSNLTNLFLNGGSLKELPIEMGQLRSLQFVYLFDNPNLSQLPLCLGNLVNLTYIDTDGTQILDSDRDSILDSCKKLRNAQAIDALPDKIKVWVNASKKDFDLSDIDQLEDKQKGDLYEWLIRLERTKDFQKDQQGLAKIVCKILKEMLKNEEFKGLFFSQVEANNESCQDRASMALNEIYTSMLLHRNQENQTLQERLQLLVGCAKTLALRNAVSQVINDHQKEQGYVEGEGVQIYLYCETHLRKILGLVTAIKSMTYTDIGKRDWVDQDALIETVNDMYLDSLVEIPAFEELLKKEKDYQEMESDQTDELDDEIFDLCKKKPQTKNELSNEYLEWEKKVNVLNTQRKEKVQEIRREWVKDKLSL